MVQAGRPLAEVKDILGHATMQTTLRYAHLQPEHLRASIAALDDALSGEMDTQMDTRTSEDAYAEKGIPQVHTKARVTVVGR